MPKPFPKEFRDDVVAVARKRQAPISQIAKDFGISEGCLHNWLRQADIEDGLLEGVTKQDAAEVRELKKRNRVVEQATRSCAGRRRFSPASRSQNDVPAGP